MKAFLKRGWWLLPAIPLLIGLACLRFDVEVLNLLPDEVPVVHGLKLYQKHFNRGRELLITLRAPDAETAEAAAQQLAEFLRQETNLVAGAVWQPPWLEDPGQMAEFIGYTWLNQPPEVFAQLTNRLAPDKLDGLLREDREHLATSMSPTEIGRLGYDPFGFTRLPESLPSSGAMIGAEQQGFASADGTFRVVFVEARAELPNYRACAAWIGDVQTAVGRCRKSPEWPESVTVHYTGSPAFVAEIATGMAGDMQLTVVTTLALIVALFWWAHGSWRPLCWLVAMLLLVELDESHGAATALGRRRGLRHPCPGRLAPPWGRCDDAQGHRLRDSPLRRHECRWFRFQRAVEQSGFGQPGAGLCARRCVGIPECRFPAAGVVVSAHFKVRTPEFKI